MTQTKYTGRKRIAMMASRNPKSEAVYEQLFTGLKEAGFILTSKQPDIVISIGGDGMLLSAFHKYEHLLNTVRFVGVHTGHLGFYTDYRDYEVEELIENLKMDTGARVSYPVLRVILQQKNGDKLVYRALNEATLKRFSKTMVADVMINQVHFEQFRGDGLSISTPTGSTAYNKSLGGAVLHPTIEALQLAEIASLNNRVYRTLGSSVVIPKKDKIAILPKHNDRYSLSVDNKTYVFDNIEAVGFQIDQAKIHFVATPRHTSFWERVKDAFIGDVES
ncbi:NAD+ kinase [Streptococcus rupicaprae]|uniref:NAD kinase n=1 Tax=Streptococcus rupicaprae TaxID=759619 RepID=A0ABV2FFB8_9STRE